MEILKSKEVAKMLRITPTTLIRLTHNGEIPAYRVGNQFRYKKADIDKYLTRCFEPVTK